MTTSFRLKWLCPIIVQFPPGRIHDRVYGYRRRLNPFQHLNVASYNNSIHSEESEGLTTARSVASEMYVGNKGIDSSINPLHEATDSQKNMSSLSQVPFDKEDGRPGHDHPSSISTTHDDFSPGMGPKDARKYAKQGDLDGKIAQHSESSENPSKGGHYNKLSTEEVRYD